jgi:hypothetical protein
MNLRLCFSSATWTTFQTWLKVSGRVCYQVSRKFLTMYITRIWDHSYAHRGLHRLERRETGSGSRSEPWRVSNDSLVLDPASDLEYSLESTLKRLISSLGSGGFPSDKGHTLGGNPGYSPIKNPVESQNLVPWLVLFGFLALLYFNSQS